jgi:hypothetical protein
VEPVTKLEASPIENVPPKMELFDFCLEDDAQDFPKQAVIEPVCSAIEQLIEYPEVLGPISTDFTPEPKSEYATCNCSHEMCCCRIVRGKKTVRFADQVTSCDCWVECRCKHSQLESVQHENFEECYQVVGPNFEEVDAWSEAAFIEGPKDEIVPVVYDIEVEPAGDIIIQLRENELVECHGNHQEDVPLGVTQEIVIFFFFLSELIIKFFFIKEPKQEETHQQHVEREFVQCDVSEPASHLQENVPVEIHEERQHETEPSRQPTLELIDLGADSVIEPYCDLMDEEYELTVDDQSESTFSDWELLSAPDELPEEGDMSDTEHVSMELSDTSLPKEVEEPIQPPDEEFILESEHQLIKKKIEFIKQLEQQPVHQAAEVQQNLKTDIDQEMISRHIEQDINSYLNRLVDEVEPELCVTRTPDVSQVVSEPVDGVSSVDDSSTQQPLEHVEGEAGDIQDLSTENVEEKEPVVTCIDQSVVGEQPRRMLEQISLPVDDVLPVFPEETVSVEPVDEPAVGTLQALDAVSYEPVNEPDREPVDVTFQELELVHVNSEQHLELQIMEPVAMVSEFIFVIKKY